MSQSDAMNGMQSNPCSREPIHVVLLTGVDRHVLNAVSFSLLDSAGEDEAIGVAYDVRANADAEFGLDVVRSIMSDTAAGVHGASQPTIFPIEACCLTCAVKHDIERLVSVFASSAMSAATVVVSLPIGVEATPVATYLNEAVACGTMGISIASVCIVNGIEKDGFASRFFEDDYLNLCTQDQDEQVFDERSTGVVIARLLREADHVLELPSTQPRFTNAVWGVQGDDDGQTPTMHDMEDLVTADRLVGAVSSSLCHIHQNAYEVSLAALHSMAISSAVS